MPATKSESKTPNAQTDKLEWAMRRLHDLPTIPSTLLQIWQLVDDPSSSAGDLERVITMDQALSAKLIRLVNSPYHGLREPVNATRQAITLLGFKTVKNLSVCASVVSACIPGKQEKGELDLSSLWRHAICTGVAADLIAGSTGAAEPGDAFTAGILHDIGKFALNVVMTREYGRAVHHAHDKNISIREAERDVIGIDHTQAGEELARQWGFPALLTDAIAHHHDPLPADGDLNLVEIVARANRLARHLRIGSSGDPLRVHASNETWLRIDVDEASRDFFLQTIESRVSEAQELMSLVC